MVLILDDPRLCSTNSATLRDDKIRLDLHKGKSLLAWTVELLNLKTHISLTGLHILLVAAVAAA